MTSFYSPIQLLFKAIFDTSFIICSLFIYFYIGWKYIANRILSSTNVSLKLPKILFASTFMVSSFLFQLIIFDILGFLNESFRLIMWKIGLWSMLFLIMFVFPFYQCYLLCRCYGLKKKRELFLACILYGSYLFLFWLICVYPFPQLTEQHTYIFSISSGISKVGIVGVTIMATLSGFGSIAFPVTHIKFFMKNVSSKDIKHYERNVLSTLNEIANKKKQLYLMNVNNESNKKEQSLFGFVTSLTHTITKQSSSISKLKNEINVLEEVFINQFNELNEIKREKMRVLTSRTWKGFVYNGLGYFFSGYCIYKIFTSLMNLIYGRKVRVDPITRVLRFIDLGYDIMFLSQAISLILIVIMILLTIRGLLGKIFKLFSEWSASFSSSNVALFLAQIMGMCFVSSVILIRTNLPEEYRTNITNVLKDLHFDFYHMWFDLIFIISSFGTLISVFTRGRSSVVDSSLN